jgi:hypothetical protein
MARSRKGTPILSCDERTRTILYLRWQALRRHSSYQLAVHECLSNLQVLYDQWITQKQMLAPLTILPENIRELAAEIDGILRHGLPQTYLAVRPPRLEDKRSLLLDLLLDINSDGLFQTLPAEARFDIAQKLLAYWQWQQAHKDLDERIAAYKDLIGTLESATDVFYSWDPSLESLPGQASELPEPARFILGKFGLLCSKLFRKPAFLQQFPPLATLTHKWRILLPLDHRIPALPLFAAGAVFPDTRPHDFSVTYGMKEFCATITVKVIPGASKEPILAEFDNLLSFATSRLNRSSAYHPKRVEERDYYSTMFRVYDLKCAGESPAAIAKLLFPTVFTDDKKPFDSLNRKYRSALQQVNDLLERAESFINKT